MKKKATITPFKGFTPESLAFLEEVRARNSKEWFEQHRDDYERVLLLPLRALVSALSGTVISIDRDMETSPAVNKTISRIYRDIRFSNDKSLFRSEAWISFKRRMKQRVTIPEFYFYVTPETFEYGMGYYAADRKSMDLFRDAVAAKPAAFRKALRFESNGKVKFDRFEDRYKRVIKNAAPEDLQDWFQLKSFCYRVQRKVSGRLYSAGLAGEISAAYSELAPLYRFLVKHTVDR